MINHFRTLLLNRSANSFDQHRIVYHRTSPSLRYLLGEIYVPPSFQPVTIPDELKSIADVLLPESATRIQRNYRVATLMDLLHTADLEKYVLKHDPRITYIPGDNRYRRMFDADIRVSRFGSYDCHMAYTKMGDWSQLPLSGDMFTWSISPSKGKISITNYQGKRSVGDLRFSAGTSTRIALIPGYLEIYFKSPSNVIDSTEEKFLLGVTNVEQVDIAGLVKRLRFEINRSNKTATTLFEPRPPYEAEFEVFKSLWDNYPDTAYQLAGLTLAFGYSLDERR